VPVPVPGGGGVGEQMNKPKHAIMDYVKLWLSNWKFRRLLPVRFARDPFGRNADWIDLPFVSFVFLITTIKALWNKEEIPGAIILVGATSTMKEWDETCEWAHKLIAEHPEWGVTK
jgi:hypothetical protein